MEYVHGALKPPLGFKLWTSRSRAYHTARAETSAQAFSTLSSPAREATRSSAGIAAGGTLGRAGASMLGGGETLVHSVNGARSVRCDHALKKRPMLR